MATTFIALFTFAGAMLVYDLRTYHDTVIKDLVTQADIIAEISTPALEFNDPKTAKERLSLLSTRPSILRAAIFENSGKRFAEYTISADKQLSWPIHSPQIDTHQINGNQIDVWKPVIRNGEILGVAYINASYEGQARLLNYIAILACVLVLSLGLALATAFWLRGAVTKPIFAVTSVARSVMQSRDFSLRAAVFTEDEIGVLAASFNDMLGEVERRAKALEESNISLVYEMAERQAAVKALHLADLRKDEFLATLAHELRNPLAPISNGLEILRLVRDQPEITANAHTVMERQLKQMVRLVDDLLDVSRINTGKLTISKTRIDIQSVIRDAVETSSPFIESCGHTLTINLPAEPIYIDADPLRLAQVFSNILNNAAKYTDPGGNINVDGVIQGDHISVSISDNGIGIAPDMLKNIFNMFTQVNQTLERTHAGLGVGLGLAKRLVELHNYELYAYSEGLGKGSTFMVYLELASQAEETPGNRHELIKHHNRERIMLVDDNVDSVETMADLLVSLGHDVRIAHNGFNALEIAREFSPRIAFLDIGMPGMSGYDLARRLKELPELAGTTLVAVTGWGQEKDRQLSREAGFDHHLVKPVKLAQLLEMIDLIDKALCS
jgi:signal transduction histidine kinase/ActR/RegA family two-component response regulator